MWVAQLEFGSTRIYALMSSQENTNDFHDRDKGDTEARTITTEIGTFPSPVPPGPTKYPGSGTPHDPYIVDWDSGDKENPYNWTNPRKWTITAQVSTPWRVRHRDYANLCLVACVLYIYCVFLQ